MSMFLKKGVRLLLKSILWFFIIIGIYFILAFIVSRIPVNTKDSDAKNEVTIYIKTNGVHTDIVVPIKNEIKDWTTAIQLEHTQSKDTTMQYVGMGWGNKDFYLNTPKWSDLKLKTALKAAFYMGKSAMHTEFYKTITETEKCKKIQLSNTEYQKLVDYLLASFSLNSDQKTQWITGKSYGNHDAFYEANRKYSFIYTCNSWANNALKAADQKAALWTLTDTGIFCHYD